MELSTAALVVGGKSVVLVLLFLPETDDNTPMLIEPSINLPESSYQ